VHKFWSEISNELLGSELLIAIGLFRKQLFFYCDKWLSLAIREPPTNHQQKKIMHAGQEKWNAAFEAVKSQFEMPDLLPDHSRKEKKFNFGFVKSLKYFKDLWLSCRSLITNLKVEVSLLLSRLSHWHSNQFGHSSYFYNEWSWDHSAGLEATF